jgi:hypothetical protein
MQIVGPQADASRIPGIDVQLGDGDTWQFGQLTARVFDTPGHTRGHITYWFPDAKALFPGALWWGSMMVSSALLCQHTMHRCMVPDSVEVLGCCARFCVALCCTC